MSPRVRSRVRTVATAVAGAALALAVLAAFRLQGRLAGIDTVFVLDVSRSMRARDVGPARADVAVGEIRRLASRETTGRAGLVIFAGDAVVACPLTTDRAAFDAALRAVDPAGLSGGTALAPALARALRMLPPSDRQRTIVLVTDGEDLGGGVGEAVAAVKQAGVRVDTLGVGTTVGATVPDPSADGGVVHDAAGRVVTSRLEPGVLRTIAAETGGSFRSVTDPSGLPRADASGAQRSLPWGALLAFSLVVALAGLAGEAWIGAVTSRGAP
jgi:Ca-activated chloride channel family protein